MANIYLQAFKTFLEEKVLIKTPSNHNFLNNLTKNIKNKEEIHRFYKRFHKIFTHRIL